MGGGHRGAAPVSLPRFHVPGSTAGALVELPIHAAHHAREVLRLRAGAAVRVFDGEGREFEAMLDSVSRQRVTVRLARAVPARAESPLRLCLALSPLKGDGMELVIQRTTELGVAEIWPVVTARTDAAARPSLQGSRQERWEKVASGAAAQCGRAVVPRIAPATDLRALLAKPFAGTRILLHEAPGWPPLASLPREDSALLLIGPAGGWEESETARLSAAGFRPVGLGPRVLRAETAAIAATSALQVLWGDLG